MREAELLKMLRACPRYKSRYSVFVWLPCQYCVSSPDPCLSELSQEKETINALYEIKTVLVI